MPLVNFSNVDFDQIKFSIQNYLKANSNFTDYDFEGSNLSTIIDTLAYNTYIASYNANMATNEVFIDSATLRENVVSLARNIGYVPRSRKSAKANISFNVNASNTSASSLTLKAGLVALSDQRFGTETYSFCIPDDITVPVRSDGLAQFYDIDIYEGTHITQTFTKSSRNPYQRFILTNGGIDTSLLRVKVFNNDTSTVSRKFNEFDSLISLDSESRIFFLQETDNERYELLFGDGTFGVALQEDEYISVDYILCNGSSGNNIGQFSYSGTLVNNNGDTVTAGVSVVSTNQSTIGGKEIESIDSIKKYAPRIYASQNLSLIHISEPTRPY